MNDSNFTPIIVPIVYPSAIEFWLSEYPERYGYNFKSRELVSLPDTFSLQIATFEAVEILKFFSMSAPLTTVSSFEKDKRHNKYLHVKSKKHAFPKNSFFLIEKGPYQLFIASPELCYLQAQEYLDFLESVKLGTQLCAQYYLDPLADYYQENRSPLTTQQSITAFLYKTKNVRNRNKAIRSSQFILDNSNSPRETAIGILATLPWHLGGYNTGKIKLNYEIKLIHSAAKYLGTEIIHADFVWVEHRFAAEYNSDLVHLNSISVSTDYKRLSAMNNSKFNVMGITSNNVIDFISLEKTMDQIRSRLRLRKNSAASEKYQELRRINAQNLLGWK